MAEEGEGRLRHFEALVAKALTSIVDLEARDLDSGIIAALAAIGEYAGADRAYIFLLSPDGCLITNTHEWCAPGVSMEAWRSQGILLDQLPWFAERIRRREVFLVPRVADLPPEAAAEREEFEAQAIVSLIVVPMVYRQALVGFLGFDAVRAERVWSAQSITILEMVGRLVTSVLERRRAELALERSEDRFRALVETTSDLTWEVDEQLRYTYLSPRVSDLLGYTPEEMVGRHRLAAVSPEDTRRVEAELAPRLATHVPYEFWECRFLHRDGHEVILETSAVPIFDDAHLFRGYRGVDRNITERKRAEAEQRRLNDRLQQKQRWESLGVLAGGMAHDFNNLLTGIAGHASVAKEDLAECSPTRRSIELIEVAAARATELTRQMLAYAGSPCLSTEAVRLPQLVAELAPLLEASIAEGTTLHFDLPSDLPPIVGDPAQLRQLVLNLCLNSAEAVGGARGLIRVRAEVRELDGESLKQCVLEEKLVPGRYVALEVVDTGGGIAPAILAQIFDPFFSTKFQGRGLGLAAVLGIVQGHHGGIQVRSQVGHGTTFTVLFPLPSTLAPTLAPAEAGGPGSAELEQTSTVTVLIVDDDPIARKVAQVILEHEGYQVLAVADGYEALEAYRVRPTEIDLVLLDLTMPEMDGEETLYELRRISPAVRVLLASGYLVEDVMGRLGDWIAGYLQKPYSRETLLRAVARAIRRGQREETRPSTTA